MPLLGCQRSNTGGLVSTARIAEAGIATPRRWAVFERQLRKTTGSRGAGERFRQAIQHRGVLSACRFVDLATMQ